MTTLSTYQIYRAENPEKIKEHKKRFYAKRAQDPERLHKHRVYEKALLIKNRLALLERFGGACVRCGQTDPVVLEIDHVHSDGAIHRERQRGAAYYKAIGANVDSGRYQLLCSCCHAVKRHELGGAHTRWKGYRGGSASCGSTAL